MAEAFRTQMDDPRMKDVPFEDRFGMLVDIEYNNRRSNGLKRLIHNAGFDQPEAFVGDIDYHSGRKLNRSLIQKLSTCEFIVDHRNIFITGATGSGKTYMACAFGMEACKQFYTTRYIRLPDLLIELETAKQNGKYQTVLSQYTRPTLLILDEWLLMPPNESETKHIFELLHRRRKKASTIFCSQYNPKGWYAQLGGKKSALADAILDRIMYDGYQINIESLDPNKDISMREIYGIPAEFRQ
jgi:DNA replication protein DnaC